MPRRQFFRLGADLPVIDRQAAAKNGAGSHHATGVPAKTMLLGVGGQEQPSRVGGDARDNVVDRINVPFQTYLFTVRRDGASGRSRLLPPVTS